ncbi:hypothetical protein PBI_SCTP2_520 [Salicola phage SCTP-2]|nr:hypothetical protein PBI_SCTP2_520 [Salicola phage SCTP-2]
MAHKSQCFLKCKTGQCVCHHYSSMNNFLKTVEQRFSQPIVTYMEDRFEQEQNGNYDQKERFFQSNKQFNKSFQGASLISSEMFDQQLKMVKLNINMRFLLKNAHNSDSYSALARYFAQYAFYAQKINRMGKNSSHNFIIDFTKNSEFLTYNYFDFLFSTIEGMHEMIKQRMTIHPEQYVRYQNDPSIYLDMDKDKVKNVYKTELADLKDKDKQPIKN